VFNSDCKDTSFGRRKLARDWFAVPELTRRVHIKLNGRVPLRRREGKIDSRYRTLPHVWLYLHGEAARIIFRLVALFPKAEKVKCLTFS